MANASNCHQKQLLGFDCNDNNHAFYAGGHDRNQLCNQLPSVIQSNWAKHEQNKHLLVEILNVVQRRPRRNIQWNPKKVKYRPSERILFHCLQNLRVCDHNYPHKHLVQHTKPEVRNRLKRQFRRQYSISAFIILNEQYLIGLKSDVKE